MYLLCVFLVYRRWIAPLPVVGQLRNVGVPWLVGAMAVVYVGVFLLGKALALPDRHRREPGRAADSRPERHSVLDFH